MRDAVIEKVIDGIFCDLPGAGLDGVGWRAISGNGRVILSDGFEDRVRAGGASRFVVVARVWLGGPLRASSRYMGR